MPKSVREIKLFNLGVVTSADDNDIKGDAAVWSKDIDPNSSEGRLKGRWKDSLIDLPVFKGKKIIATPDSDGEFTRQVNISSPTIVGMQLHDNVDSYELQINLVGTAPTANVTVKFKMANFGTDKTYLKISHNGTNYNNGGEYDTLTFTPANYATYQTLYLVPQSFSVVDIIIPIDVTTQSTDALFNSSSVESTLIYTFKATVDSAPAIVIKRSTYKLYGVVEGVAQGFKVQLKLAHSPSFPDYDTDSVIITFTSNDQGRLYVHWTGSGAKESTKSFYFNNLNYATYQTLYPFILDDGVKQGSLQFSMTMNGNANYSVLYEQILDADGIDGNVRFDDGTLLDNDFHSPLNPFNVVGYESSTGSGGTGESGKDGEKGWNKP